MYNCHWNCRAVKEMYQAGGTGCAVLASPPDLCQTCSWLWVVKNFCLLIAWVTYCSDASWWPDPTRSCAILSGSYSRVITSLKKIIHFWSWWGSSSVWHPGYSPHSQPLIEQVLDFLFASLKKCSRTVDGEFKCFTAFLGDVACCFMAQMISQRGFS